MTTILQQLIKSLPLLIVGLTVIFLTISIAWNRNHFFSAILSITGLNAALISLWFIRKMDTAISMHLMHIDNCALFYSGLILLSSLVTCIISYFWLEHYTNNKEEFYILVLTATLGGVLLTSANHLISLSLGIELISIPLFGLIGYSLNQRSSLEASIKYVILSSISSSFLLFGIAFLYAQSGDLSFESLSRVNLNDNILYKSLLLSGLGLIIVALSFKLSLVPFHSWTPDVYQGSPSPVSAFLATVGKIPIFIAMMRLFLYLPEETKDALRVVVSVIASSSIIFGNLMALNQTNIKRLLSYSSISHFGYLLVPLIALQNKQIIMETVSIYLISYLLSNLSTFGVISLISISNRGIKNPDSLSIYRGLFWNFPISSIVMTITVLSLAGVPMTLGFTGKFYILISSLETNMWYLACTVIIGSSIGFYYYLRVAVSFYLKAPQQFSYSLSVNWKHKLGESIVLIIALPVLIFGIYPQLLINIAQNVTIP